MSKQPDAERPRERAGEAREVRQFPPAARESFRAAECEIRQRLEFVWPGFWESACVVAVSCDGVTSVVAMAIVAGEVKTGWLSPTGDGSSVLGSFDEIAEVLRFDGIGELSLLALGVERPSDQSDAFALVGELGREWSLLPEAGRAVIEGAWARLDVLPRFPELVRRDGSPSARDREPTPAWDVNEYSRRLAAKLFALAEHLTPRWQSVWAVAQEPCTERMRVDVDVVTWAGDSVALASGDETVRSAVDLWRWQADDEYLAMWDTWVVHVRPDATFSYCVDASSGAEERAPRLDGGIPGVSSWVRDRMVIGTGPIRHQR